MKSRIFTDKQIVMMNKRVNGNKSDNTGMFCKSIKPKILEILQILKENKSIKFYKNVLKGGIEMRELNRCCECGKLLSTEIEIDTNICVECNKNVLKGGTDGKDNNK